MNPVNTSQIFEIQFNVILQSTTSFAKWSLLLRFPDYQKLISERFILFLLTASCVILRRFV